jgi:hypothetical protein
MIDNILSKLPKIDNDSLIELMNVIEQSKQFGNFNNKDVSKNEFELNYARYLGLPNDEFINEYKNIVLEACFREFMEWYEYLTKHILRNDVQKALGISFSATDHDWVTQFKKSPLIGWAFQINDINIFLKNIHKVKDLGHTMVNFFNARKPLSILDDDYFDSDHAQLVLDSIDKILINDDRQEIINQLNSNSVVCMIEVYGWENRFNPILLEWICTNREKIKYWN